MVYDSDVIRRGIEGWLFSRGMDNPEAREQVADNVLLFINSAHNMAEREGEQWSSQPASSSP